MHPASCTNIHHDVTNLVDHGMVKNAKIWISWERNLTFLPIKTFLTCASNDTFLEVVVL